MQAAAAFRHHMIDGQLEPNRVLSPAVCAAMGVVAREWFLPEALAQCAYADEHLPLGGGRFVVSPLLLGHLLQALDVRQGHKVLAVGSGTGYGAAVLQHMGCHVTMVEESQELANKARSILSKHQLGDVEVSAGALHMGCETAAPYDRVLVEGGAQQCPDAWTQQLSPEGGKMAYVAIESLLPLPHMGRGFVTVVERQQDQFLSTTLDGVAAPVLPGTELKRGFDFD